MLTIFVSAQRKRRLIVLIIALALGSAVMSFRQQSLQSSAISDYFNQSTQAEVVLTTDPHLTSKRVSGRNFLPPSYSALATLLRFESENKTYKLRVPVRVILSDLSAKALLPGQHLSIKARVLESKEPRVAALLLANSKIQVVTSPSKWAASLARIRLGLRSASGSGDGASLIPGMVLGDTSLQSEEFKDQMRRSGLTHLV
ncbi:MAG: DUF4131 domain-containing protein, partial [Actinobacteria bacterium]|nr:DUF4131 domain-containing protein [Actinomycetota bacterium]